MMTNSLQQQVMQLTHKGLSLNEIIQLTGGPADIIQNIFQQCSVQYKRQSHKAFHQHQQALYAMQLNTCR